jgi:hypothetical protein
MGSGVSAQREEEPVAITENFNKTSTEEARSLGKKYFDQFVAVRNGTASTSSSISASELTELASVSEATVQGLLSLGEKLPMFGSVAGALLIFYGKCKVMGSNFEALQLLIKTTVEAGEWVYESVPLLQEAQGASKLQLTDLNNLCTAVIDASNLISLISSHYNNPPIGKGKGVRRIVNAVRNFVLSNIDEKNIDDTQLAVKDALLSFKTTLIGAQALQSIKSPIEKLREALDPVDFKDTINRHCAKYFEGSREWLFEELLKWLDDVSQNSDKEAIKAKKTVPAMNFCFSFFLSIRLFYTHFCLYHLIICTGVLVSGRARHGKICVFCGACQEASERR